jgi:RNA polymerase sporulation-specific sigma factor
MGDKVQYREMTDEQLIALLRGQDTDVMEYILTKYKPLVRKRANAMFLIGGETEDLIQEGMIGLFKAIRDFDETKETSFYTFAELCVTRQLYSAVEASGRKKHAPLNSYVSLYDNAGEEGIPLSETLRADDTDNPEEIVIDRETGRQFWEQIRTRLSALEREVLDLYLSGLTYQQIAVALGKSPKAIDNALTRIRGKILQERP